MFQERREQEEVRYSITSPLAQAHLFNMTQSKRWCFTLNNYTTDEQVLITGLYPEKVSYLIFGRETGEEGTPHLQGYFELVKKARLGGVKKLIPRAHFEMAKASAEDNFDYCTKEEDYEEFGEIQKKQGTRNDLQDFKEAVQSGMLSIKELREEHSDVVAKYPRFAREYLNDYMPEPELQNHPLREWQGELYNALQLEPDDRLVRFIVDNKGNAGKTWFAKYYTKMHENAQYMEMAKKADMAYALRPEIRVLFVNITRQQVEYMNYSFLESVKDGLVFSNKYESGLKQLGKCHVVILMNQYPDMTLLSSDRYHITELN